MLLACDEVIRLRVDPPQVASNAVPNGRFEREVSAAPGMDVLKNLDGTNDSR